jgi:hypothetical protein
MILMYYTIQGLIQKNHGEVTGILNTILNNKNGNSSHILQILEHYPTEFCKEIYF